MWIRLKYIDQKFKVAEVSEARPICPQGLTCQSADPQHFMTYQHTPIEKHDDAGHNSVEPKNFELPPKLAEEVLTTTPSEDGEVDGEGKRHSRSLSLEEEKKARQKKALKRKSLDSITNKRLSAGNNRKSTSLIRDGDVIISLDSNDEDEDSDDEKRDKAKATSKKTYEKLKWEEMEKNLGDGGGIGEDLRKQQKEERKRMIAEAKRKKKEKEKEEKKKRNSKGGEIGRAHV